MLFGQPPFSVYEAADLYIFAKVMDYLGAEGLEFGNGNVNLDPAVLRGAVYSRRAMMLIDGTKSCHEIVRSSPHMFMASASGPARAGSMCYWMEKRLSRIS